MRIGVDVDGVLANFNKAFNERTIQMTGRDLFPPRPFDIPCWDYTGFYGYTNEEEASVWESIRNDPYFWRKLEEYPNTPFHILTRLAFDNDVYFITARPGVLAKHQTEIWLGARIGANSTVLISHEKGLCAEALELDNYIDDKFANLLNVRDHSPKTKVFLMDRPWNREFLTEPHGINRVDSIACLGVSR